MEFMRTRRVSGSDHVDPRRGVGAAADGTGPPPRTALKKPVRLDRMAGVLAATGDARSRGIVWATSGYSL